MVQVEDHRLPAGAREALVNDPSFLLEAALNRFLRSRQLKTRVGTISLAVPMDREGTFRTELFERYQRSEKALVGTLMEMAA